MKHSIRFKITALLTALIVFTIFLYWFLNRTLLEEFYLSNKIKTLEDTYSHIKDIYEVGDNESLVLSDEATIRMERLSSNHNMSIYVLSGKFFEIYYPTPENIGHRETEKIYSTLQGYLYKGSNPFIKNSMLIKNTEEKAVISLYDNQLSSRFIILVGKLDNDNIVYLRTSYESIQESVDIANKFLAYIGMIAVAIGVVAMLIISRKFTTPILQLANIAKKMSDLDFNIKYDVKSKDEIGELGKSINVLSDKLEHTISELKGANNELLKDIQQKNEVDEMRKEFLSNVSHELKTPLSLIQGYAEGLKENINEDEESRNFYCDVIIDEADKMNKMVKKLLALNEIEFGKTHINFERFDMVSLIKTVLGATEILFRNKDVTLHFDEYEPIYVWADEYMVEQVITNYISNALNHVSGPKIIEIKLIRREEVIRVAVFNTGDNIPEEDIEKIWDKFYKVDKARTREYGGNGIGLSIVKAIMNSLNRECGVINRPVGVEFWFELDARIDATP